ncbi:hypothetical protein INR49_022517 [Caranx melampygus]|nr:hypothetical protein INR49_022517 [Caranx melampygus]
MLQSVVNSCSKLIGRPQLSLSALYNRHLVREAPSILAHSSHSYWRSSPAAVQVEASAPPKPPPVCGPVCKKRRVSSDQESPRKRLRKAKEPIEEVLEARGSKRKATDMVVDTDSCFSIDDSSITLVKDASGAVIVIESSDSDTKP